MIRVGLARLAFASASALTQWSCGAPAAIAPDRPLDVQSRPLPPYAIHEECASLVPGDRLRYRFESTAPIDFAIQYRDGKVVVMPVSRERTDGDAGTFAPLDAQVYCLTWEAGSRGATIGYSVELLRGAPK